MFQLMMGKKVLPAKKYSSLDCGGDLNDNLWNYYNVVMLSVTDIDDKTRSNHIN